MGKYMMATKATHQLGDISSDEPDICYIKREGTNNYVGHWVTGMGFVDVKFPKETTRDLTPEEIEYWNKKSFQIGSQPSYKLMIKEGG